MLTIRQRSPQSALPVLGRGRHPDEGAGMCLMEFTALLAGELRSDRPRSVHPLLAAMARVINDSVGDDVRDQLLWRAPSFVGTNSNDVHLADLITLTVVEAGLPVALPIWAPRLRRARAQLRVRKSRAAGPMTARRMRSAERTVTLSVAGLAMTPHDAGDAAMIELLDEVLWLVGRAGSGHTGPPGNMSGLARVVGDRSHPLMSKAMAT